MIKHGCRKVAFLAPTIKTLQSSRRLEGYKQALTDCGIEVNEKLILNCRQDFAEIYATVKKLVQEEKPDAIFCLYDYATIPVFKVASDLGLRVPDDMMVMGYDNIEVGAYLEKSLTTVDPRQKEQGYRAAEMMIALLNGKERPIRNIVEPTLIIRESTGNLV